MKPKPWKKIIPGAMFYSLLMPPDSSVLVKTFEVYNLPKCTFGSDPFCSFIDTPYFGNPNTFRYQQKQIGFYIILCNPILFSVNTFDVSDNGRLCVTTQGQQETFHHTNLSIYFYEHNLGHTGARIYITNV
uniref:Uncharacterized protein n=1 Tax=Panagrolaimus superbus TaxID=310955 RepID=A0A914ZG36_9BILA